MELKKLAGGQLRVTLSENGSQRFGSIQEFFEMVATQFYWRRLNRYSPESIQWAIRFPGESPMNAHEEVGLCWDGERFAPLAAAVR